ncbi:MAG: hypothetical protein HGA39_08230 [Coriobacteriia bacterium]|nr:hypothetical protein [Coriobacteriia bacterium]
MSSRTPSGDDPGANGASSGLAIEAAQLRALHEGRALAELAEADALAPGSDAVAWRGSLLATVAVVKGLPGEAESCGGAALSGADGHAAESALEALGYAADTLFYTLSRPEPGIDQPARSRRLRRQIEAVDPALVLAVDMEAAQDVAAAFGITTPPFGAAVTVLGRKIVAVNGLEASLSDPARKRAVWAQMQAARARGPVY